MIEEDIDDEEFWEELLAYIEERRVVPVVGSALLAVPDEGGTSATLYRILARRLAEKLRIDPSSLPPQPDFNDVVSGFVSRGGRREEVYPKLRLLLRDLDPRPPLALERLAEIDGFDLFVSLTFDSLLADALNRVRFSGEARALQLTYSPARADDLPRDWNRRETPAVYHLLGKLSAAPEFAVSDEDVLEFVTSLQSDARRPNLLFDELRGSHLLVIGAALPEWLSRFFLRVTKARQLSLARSEKEILVDHSAQHDARMVSFVRNFSYGTRLVDREPAEFVDELHRRWMASGRGSKPTQNTSSPSERETDSSTRESMRPGSIFLSYAKEDLPQVMNLKAALDRAGIEAWLDKERLEAGDLYDQKIRRFIKTSAVFIPVISRNTERRVEGYFRREWKLAAERAQGIAEHIPFILPVVVDDTPEYGASVPECFLSAQWTRLLNGESGGEFEVRLGAIIAEFKQRHAAAA